MQSIDSGQMVLGEGKWKKNNRIKGAKESWGSMNSMERRGVRGKVGKEEKAMNTLQIQNSSTHLSFQQSSTNRIAVKLNKF